MMLSARSKHYIRRLLLILPVAVTLTTFFFYPLFATLALAFQDPAAQDTISWSNLHRFISDPYYWAIFGQTLWIAFVTTAICLLLGFPVAFHLQAISSDRTRIFWTLIILAPLMISLVVSSFAWVIILGGNGLIAGFIRSLGLEMGSSLLNSSVGVIIVSVYSFISYMILNIYGALRNIDPHLSRAAAIHGASPSIVLYRLFIPLSLPGVISGTLIVFSMSLSAFVIPFLIGGGRVRVTALFVYNYTVQLYDWNGAAALALILFVLTLLLTWSLAAIGSRICAWERS